MEVKIDEQKILNEFSFTPLTSEEKRGEVVERPSVGYWADAWRRLKSNKVALVSLITLILIILAAAILPSFIPYKFDATDLSSVNLKPGNGHVFGTDSLGRDLLVRVLYGTRYSLIIGFAAAIINLVIGVIYGGVAGFFGGRVDNIMMRIVDILYSIPTIIYVVLIMAFFSDPNKSSSGLVTIIMALSISYWIGMARIVRGEVLQLKQQEFVLAARSLGASKGRILFRHLLPNCVGSIIVTMTLLIPQAIFTEAFLSFIGLGINPPLASLGTLANEAMQAIYVYPYQLLFPSLAICLIILGFNLLGDGLSEALDPKHKR
ncbi:MAG: ABC transporter permease [Clostridium sp.]